MTEHQVFWVCVLGILGVTAIAVVPLSGLFWRKIIRDWKAADLKLAMIERGYSADDIERVLRAGEPDKLAVSSHRRGPEYAR
jgi:hypothetical protein